MPNNKETYEDLVHKELDINTVSDSISALLEGGEGDDRLPPIEIDLDTYNEEEFFKGIDDASYNCGVITAMLNSGVSEDFVLTYLINKETIEYNLKTIEMNNATQVEIAKHQKVILEREEL